VEQNTILQGVLTFTWVISQALSPVSVCTGSSLSRISMDTCQSTLNSTLFLEQEKEEAKIPFFFFPPLPKQGLFVSVNWQDQKSLRGKRKAVSVCLVMAATSDSSYAVKIRQSLWRVY